MKLILASQSPRRRELLAEAGYEFCVVPPGEDAERGYEPNESPSELVSRLAWQKARDVAERIDHGLVLGCDTVAECQGQILGKPRSRGHATAMLRMMSGEAHRVYSGVCLWQRPSDRFTTRVDITYLRMESISDVQLENYLDTGLWAGKAGAFGYQDGLDWIRIEQGSETNVVGLPMELLRNMLAEITDSHSS